MMATRKGPAVLRRSTRLAAVPTAGSAASEPDSVKHSPLTKRSRQSSNSSAASRAPKRPVVIVPTRAKEEALWKLGFKTVCGVDEAGRGPLAGPVVAAACVIPPDAALEGLRDSKKLSEQQREKLFADITTCPGVSYAVQVVGVPEIDQLNILQASLRAMAGCVLQLHSGGGTAAVDYALVDGNQIPPGLPQSCQSEAVVKGDSSCRVIAAASILAKVTRDRLMVAYDLEYPQYGFAKHKGYGTAQHIASLLRHGPCPLHRRSFAPLKDWENVTNQPAAGTEQQGENHTH